MTDRLPRVEPQWSLAEASRRLDPEQATLDHGGRRLRRLMLAAERRAGRRLGVRVPGARKTRWLVTEGILRRWLPELFGAKPIDDLRRELTQHLGTIDQRIDDRAEAAALRVVAPLREEVRANHAEAMGAVVDLAKRVARIVDPPTTSPGESGTSKKHAGSFAPDDRR